MKKKVLHSFIIVITIIFSTFSAFAIPLIPGGESIGIILNYNGIYITGTYDYTINQTVYNPKNDDFLPGDLIIGVNNHDVSSINDLGSMIQNSLNHELKVSITLLRDTTKMNRDLKVAYDPISNTFKTGLYVKDTTAGIGTMTYYDPSNQSFGALGHSLNDTALNLEIANGKICNSRVNNIVKNTDEKTGEKIAVIEEDKKIGMVKKNTDLGVFGTYDEQNNTNLMESAKIDEIELGSAYVLTVLNGSDVEKIDIEIIDLKKQSSSEPKGITFKIVDSKVLEKTNGIIQGMSGSPIIQNDKIIGAISHVNAKDRQIGYGVYIEWMLEQSSNLN